MTTPFEIAEKNAHQFMAGLHTMQEIVKSLDDHKHALEMIEACSRHKDLEPGIINFQEDVAEIEDFWFTVANIYSIIGQLES
jgi:hypothetical protein